MLLLYCFCQSICITPLGDMQLNQVHCTCCSLLLHAVLDRLNFEAWAVKRPWG